MIKIPDGKGTRHVLLAYARRDRAERQASRGWIRGPGARPLQRGRRGGPPPRGPGIGCSTLCRPSWWARCSATASRCTTRTGLRHCPTSSPGGGGTRCIPVLYRLAVDGPDAARVRADYHRTLAELYQENFVAVVRRWAASRGVSFRIQSYGTPPATISSYRFADMFEGEGWGWKEITPTRWASSAGHLYGREVVSAEIWTWVHSPSFRATPLDLKGEAHEHLLNGINQLIGHGWPYSPADAPGLGWFFYAAGAIDDRNPWWPAMPQLNAYLSRLCWLLRQGEPVADVAVYVPDEDLFAVMGRAVGGSLDTWREANRRIGAAVPATIRMAGLDYDLIDDDALAIIPPTGIGWSWSRPRP